MSDSSAHPCLPPNAGSEVAGVIVLFHPDQYVGDHIAAALSQVDVLYVVDNTPTDATHDSIADFESPKVTLIHKGVNVGLGAAYNLACDRARANGYDWVLLLDQDTMLFESFMSTMIDRLTERAELGLPPAGVAGPGFEHRTARAARSAPAARADESASVVSSGSLVCLRCWEQAGPFQEDFFIDYVDVDFCLRAREAGFAVVAISDVLMAHGIGNPTENVIFGYRRMTSNYPPLRHYYIARNFVLILRRRSGLDRMWIRRELVKRAKFTALSLVMEPRRWSIARATARGVVDGLRGRAGPLRRDDGAP